MYPFPQSQKITLTKLIWNQIEKAFQSNPNLASTIQGQRKIHQGCLGRRTALFPSTKSAGAIPLESRLELAHAICLEQNIQVKKFRTQALKIPLSGGNCCYPDFIVQNLDGSFEVHEVKPSRKALATEEIQKFEHVSKILNQMGILFKLIDQSDLPTTKQLQNLLYLYQRGHRKTWTALEVDLAIRTLKDTFFLDIEGVHTSLNKVGLACELGDYLVFHKKIKINSIGEI